MPYLSGDWWSLLTPIEMIEYLWIVLLTIELAELVWCLPVFGWNTRFGLCPTITLTDPQVSRDLATDLWIECLIESCDFFVVLVTIAVKDFFFS